MHVECVYSDLTSQVANLETCETVDHLSTLIMALSLVKSRQDAVSLIAMDGQLHCIAHRSSRDKHGG
jgi:hypothetical protein